MFKVTLQHTLMITESQFSEVLLSRNLLLALQPIGLSKFCTNYGIAHTLGNRKTYLTKLFVFTALEKAHFKIIHYLQKNFIFHSANVKILIKLFYQTHDMPTDTHAKFEVKSLASSSAMKF